MKINVLSAALLYMQALDNFSAEKNNSLVTGVISDSGEDYWLTNIDK